MLQTVVSKLDIIAQRMAVKAVKADEKDPLLQSYLIETLDLYEILTKISLSNPHRLTFYLKRLELLQKRSKEDQSARNDRLNNILNQSFGAIGSRRESPNDPQITFGKV